MGLLDVVLLHSLLLHDQIVEVSARECDVRAEQFRVSHHLRHSVN
jgi:hypothetical protein